MDIQHRSLMEMRIRRILLVCTNYDSFVLNEDGRIDVQIAEEYAELNLSNPPSVFRTESMQEALDVVRSGEHFDLVIVMNNADVEKAFIFGREMKDLSADTPIVLLSAFSKSVFEHVYIESALNSEGGGVRPIDYVFCWNNSSDLIIAIIKLLEDKLNADHDILEEGVRAILLVEDSVRYYSTYLPLLYKLILKQNSIAIRDALNEQLQVVRKRSRPKLLMATCYDEAVELYNRYSSNIIGVISDIGFVLHRGNLPEQEKLDAGFDFCRLVRSDNPTMPVLMQSSQESMRSEALALGAGFVVKSSKTLMQQLSDYIGREFGFGDFVAIDPSSGHEIGRANDLEGFERIISSIPADAFRRLSDNNYLSKWLFARGLFSVGKEVSKLKIIDDSDIENVRSKNIALIHDYRENQAQGVVARFDAASYNDTIWFSRIGTGSLGGKARGLAFLNHVLQKYRLYNAWEHVRVTVPRSLVISTEFFDRFIADNGLQYVIESDLNDDEILAEFVAATLPRDLIEALRCFISVSHRPLAIRSSSKLEDSYYQPFAGVYSTYMIPSSDNEDQELRLLGKAIKSVYAAVYFAGARSYITSTGNLISDEKMAVIIQEVCGAEENGLYFPTLSGVARSINFYPVGNERADEGIVKVAYGLGKVVVDGEQVLRFSPKHTNRIIQISTPELALRETQKSMLALSMQPELFRTSVDDSINLRRLNISECDGMASLRHVASTFDRANERLVDSCAIEGSRLVTFSQILKHKSFPLAAIIERLLSIAAEEMKCPVEIEFAAQINEKLSLFNVLQIRPISADSMNASINWKQIDQSGAMIISNHALGVGKIGGMRDIIYLKSNTFDKLHTIEMAETLRAWNINMRNEKRHYLLIGYGRWGSNIPSLGVPIQWSDISESAAVVETNLADFRVEPSQGSHFFQNMTSFNVGYMNVDSFANSDELFDESQLNRLEAVEETEYMRHIRLDEELEIVIDGLSGRGMVKVKGERV